jgi:hypothetical protein
LPWTSTFHLYQVKLNPASGEDQLVIDFSTEFKLKLDCRVARGLVLWPSHVMQSEH